MLTTDPYVTSDPALTDLDDVIEEADLLVVGAPHQAYASLRVAQPVVESGTSSLAG